MKTNTTYRWLTAAISLATALTSLAAAIDMGQIDKITGLKGTMNKQEGVYKVTFPRDDAKVSVDGWKMPPFMGLGTWAAFQGTNEKAMVMGDTVLFQDEVNAAMSVALDNGLSVTALHNHFFYDEPKVFFMHIGGEGSIDALASAVRKVYDKIEEVRSANPKPQTTFGAKQLPEKNSITLAPLNESSGCKARQKMGWPSLLSGRNQAWAEWRSERQSAQIHGRHLPEATTTLSSMATSR